MLIDTQANGTAIRYDGANSEEFHEIDNEEIEVKLLGGYITGKNVTD
jgi:hypothetical protein